MSGFRPQRVLKSCFTCGWLEGGGGRKVVHFKHCNLCRKSKLMCWKLYKIYFFFVFFFCFALFFFFSFIGFLRMVVGFCCKVWWCHVTKCLPEPLLPTSKLSDLSTPLQSKKKKKTDKKTYVVYSCVSIRKEINALLLQKYWQNHVGLTVIPLWGQDGKKFFVLSFSFLLSSACLGPPERNCSKPVH